MEHEIDLVYLTEVLWLLSDIELNSLDILQLNNTVKLNEIAWCF